VQTLPKLTNTRLQYYGNEEGGDAVCMGGEDDIEDDMGVDDIEDDIEDDMGVATISISYT